MRSSSYASRALGGARPWFNLIADARAFSLALHSPHAHICPPSRQVFYLQAWCRWHGWYMSLLRDPGRRMCSACRQWCSAVLHTWALDISDLLRVGLAGYSQFTNLLHSSPLSG